MGVVNASFDNPMKREEKASGPLAGGLMMNGYQCGMLWGAALAAGAQAFELLGPGAGAEAAALAASQKTTAAFSARKPINCSDITAVDWRESSTGRMALQGLKFVTIKGGPALCFSLAARYAREAQREINLALSNGQAAAPAPPVSCASLLARKMGASEQHAVMAAGFAGGIGLSGGACGALGAAIWLAGMGYLDEAGLDDDIWSSPAFKAKGGALIERFLDSSDYVFECEEIVGRSFADANDHAAYVRGGGCAAIIEALAAG